MIGFQDEKEYYMKLQEHLFEMIPESWKTILLHTSIIDIPNQKPKGEMYIYYIPKGLLKRKPVNCYEVPALFDIDEEEYSRLITSLYNIIKLLRDSYKKFKKKAWSTIDITCTNSEFIVKYGFENLELSEYTPEERHIIWRYDNLNIDLDSLNRKERKVLDYYIRVSQVSLPPHEEICKTEVIERPAQAFVDYERSLTLDEIIARDKEAARQEEKRQKKLAKKKRKKQLDILETDDTESIISNQILK
jgi:hypothetical protein